MPFWQRLQWCSGDYVYDYGERGTSPLWKGHKVLSLQCSRVIDSGWLTAMCRNLWGTGISLGGAPDLALIGQII